MAVASVESWLPGGRCPPEEPVGGPAAGGVKGERSEREQEGPPAGVGSCDQPLTPHVHRTYGPPWSPNGDHGLPKRRAA
jgi:hypothetical protein